MSAPGLAWSFAPETPQINLRTGETATVYFKVTNHVDRATAAQAMFNVTPGQRRRLFRQDLLFLLSPSRISGPHETVEMPVVFFLDPALEKDETMDGIERSRCPTHLSGRAVHGGGASGGRSERPRL